MQEIEVTTEKMVFEGRALARVARYVIFVEGALPGERVLARIITRKRKFSVATAVKIIEPSAMRQVPDCPLFGPCGGCTFRHCSYANQLKIKQEVFTESMHPAGDGIEERVLPILGAKQLDFYRNKMVFSFGFAEGNPTIGLHRKGDYYELAPAHICKLQSPQANEIQERTLAFVLKEGIPIFDGKKQAGTLRDLMIREGKNTGQRLVQINATAFHPALEKLAGPLGDLCDTLLVGIDPKTDGPPHPAKFRILKGDGRIEEKVNGLSFEIGSETFFQTNTAQAELLFGEIAVRASELKPQVALDLYAGVGPIAMHLASSAREVIGMESNPLSVHAAEENLRRNNIGNVRMVCAEVEKAEDRLFPDGVDLVVVDPPRPGLHKKAIENIVRIAPEHILYVSCNPATLARDLQLFTGQGYTTHSIQPVDMFPHTFHLEAIAVLDRTGKSVQIHHH